MNHFSVSESTCNTVRQLMINANTDQLVGPFFLNFSQRKFLTLFLNTGGHWFSLHLSGRSFHRLGSKYTIDFLYRSRFGNLTCNLSPTLLPSLVLWSFFAIKNTASPLINLMLTIRKMQASFLNANDRRFVRVWRGNIACWLYWNYIYLQIIS